MNFRPFIFSAAFLFVANLSFAQDNLVNSLKSNVSNNAKEGFKFTHVIDLGTTSVKNQGSSGTCWSYSANSFLESEMIKNKKTPVELSQLFTARCAYIEKAKNYVRMHGAVSLGEGGAFHDVINMYRKYGTVPRSVYSGLNYGTKNNKLGEMSAITEAMLPAIVKNANGKLTQNWLTAYTATVDAYLGKAPESFEYNGKVYTPQTFAKEVVGLNADDYIEISSFNDHPFYKSFTLLVPDNWDFNQVQNVKINELTDIIDNALKTGYTVAWAADVSEKSFSWANGVAFVPSKPFEEMTATEKTDMFNGPKPEMNVTQEARQEAFDNYQTTDDHGMHIVGLAKDQNGKEYYIVKNSWGESNDYKGYLYVTKEYVKYKSTCILVNKKAIPATLKKQMAL